LGTRYNIIIIYRGDGWHMPKVRKVQFDFQAVCGREFWITQTGERKFPHEFDDEHLANTIRYLHKKGREHRLEEARKICEMIRRTGHEHVDIETYFRHYRRQMDNVLEDVSDKDWLKSNCKIYTLLLEEAVYRGIDLTEQSPTKTTYKGKVTAKYNFAKKFSYLFNS
jgi:hypothetical protein